MTVFSGKVALVTGAGRGIGRATSLFLAEQGARLVLDDVGSDLDGTGRDDTVVAKVAEEAALLGVEVASSAEDAGAPGAADRLIDLARSRFGRLDAVVASAGIVRDRSILHATDDDLDAMLTTHVRAAHALTRAASRVMIEGGGGSIVLMTSPAAFFGAARKTAAAAAAAAIVGLARSAAVELRRHRIRVNCVAPTARTRATETLPTFQGIREGSMSPEHVARVAAFLASDAASEIVGEVVGVAGDRVYAIRARETTGAFSEGRPFSLDELVRAWPEISRG